MKVRIGVGMGPLDGDPSGLAGLVDDLDEKWSNKNAKMFTIRATKYANF